MNADYIYKARVDGINTELGTLLVELQLGFYTYHVAELLYTTDAATTPQRVIPPVLLEGNVYNFQTFKPGTLGRTGGGNGYSLELATQNHTLKYSYKALVTRVLDGDTFEAKIDVGFGNWVIMDIRMQGIDAPALNKPGGQAAKTWLQNAILDQQVILECWQMGDKQFEKYGRFLALVYHPSNFIPQNQVLSINAEMLRLKLAKVMPTGAAKPPEISWQDL